MTETLQSDCDCTKGIIVMGSTPPKGFVEVQACDDCRIAGLYNYKDDVEAAAVVSRHVYYWHLRRGFMAPALMVDGFFKMMWDVERVDIWPTYLDWYGDETPGAVRVIIPRDDAIKTGLITTAEPLSMDLQIEADVAIGLPGLETDVALRIADRVRDLYHAAFHSDLDLSLMKINVGSSKERVVKSRYGSFETIRMIESIIAEEGGNCGNE